MRVLLSVIAAVAVCLGVAGCGNDSTPATGGGAGAPAATPTAATGAKTIKILWAQWAPADALQTLSAEYTKTTGTTVFVDQKDWGGAFQQTKQAEFNNNGQTYDIIIGDSQWVGQGVVGGHYAELTDFVKSNPDCFNDVAPKAMTYYCEYPKGSAKYFAIPCESDAIACVYRKDLFESQKHKDGFKAYLAKNGQADFALDVPKTWEQFLWISKYFKEASGEPDMVGVVMPTSRGYDEITMAFEPMLWSFGGDWGDQRNNVAKVNTPEAVKALSFMKDLVATSSEGGKEMGYSGVQSTFTNGRAAMAITFFAFFPAFASKDVNRDYWDKTGYFNVPAGPKGRFTALGGQGLSLNAHVSDDRKKEALAFMKWFSTPETQAKWAKLGGFSANSKVLASADFKAAAPYNPLFEEAFGMMLDFWNIPQYDQLLSTSQDEVSAAIKGTESPEDAIRNIQSKHEGLMMALRK